LINPHQNLGIGCLSNDILWWLSPLNYRSSLFLYLVLVRGAVAD
jgi:hypothetical protein